MATSNDHPGLPFVQARGFTNGRPDGKPLWIVVHDMEATETPTRAEATAAYFATLTDGRRVSAHYCVDENSVVQCVDLDDSAWTVGNRQGNNRGINWELSGFASQTRGLWLDTFGRAMFAEMAPLVRSDGKRFGIPLQRRTVAELRAMKPGITSHNDLRLAFGGTTHTDPGPNFPWDVFLAVMRGDDDMSTAGDSYGYNSSAIVREMCLPNPDWKAPQKNEDGSTAETLDPRLWLERQADAVVAKLPPVPGLDVAELASAIAAELAVNVEFISAVATASAEATADELHRRTES